MTKMQPLPLLLALMLGLGALAGCTNPPTTPTTTAPAPSKCYPGCESNSDAMTMLTRFGLHQLTNGSKPRDPQLDGGLATWTEGGFNRPLIFHAAALPSPREYILGTSEDQPASSKFSSSCCLIFGLTPIGEGYPDYSNSTTWLWNPVENLTTQVPRPHMRLYPGGFDGDWALMVLSEDFSTGVQSGLWALNVHTHELRELVPEQLRSTGARFSEHIQWKMISGHSAFVGLVEEAGPEYQGSLVEFNLDTASNETLLRANQSLIGMFDASPRYLVVPTDALGKPGVWIMDRANRTWWNLEKDPAAQFADPKVAGDWCIFEEHFTNPRKTTLVGIHIPTGKKYDLIPSNNEMSMIAWDTDGQRVVVQLELELQNSWAKYPGVQLYWMDLPRTP
jgi:hypothetical protein